MHLAVFNSGAESRRELEETDCTGDSSRGAIVLVPCELGRPEILAPHSHMRFKR